MKKGNKKEKKTKPHEKKMNISIDLIGNIRTNENTSWSPLREQKINTSWGISLASCE
jgi:hypothetical protein